MSISVMNKLFSDMNDIFEKAGKQYEIEKGDEEDFTKHSDCTECGCRGYIVKFSSVANCSFHEQCEECERLTNQKLISCENCGEKYDESESRCFRVSRKELFACPICADKFEQSNPRSEVL